MCSAAAGTCVLERDGYYITTGICLVVGLIFLVAYIIPTGKRLQGLYMQSFIDDEVPDLMDPTALPLSKWRVAI